MTALMNGYFLAVDDMRVTQNTSGLKYFLGNCGSQLQFSLVDYLHQAYVQCVLHRDVKSSNVMLDADFKPHLGDFELFRLIDHEKFGKSTTMAGKFRCIAPEIHFTGKATKESDLYSFGILMLEVICGRRPVSMQVEDPAEDFMLLQAVWQGHEDDNILNSVDPGLLNVHSHQLKLSRCSTAVYNTRFDKFMCESFNELFSNTLLPVVAGSGNMTLNVGDVERKIVPLLQLGLQCCLLHPES